MAGKNKEQSKGRTPSYDKGKGQAEIFLNALLYIVEEESESNNPFATWDQYLPTHLWVKRKTLRELAGCVTTWISEVGLEKVVAELRTSEAREIIQNEIEQFDKEYIRNALLALDKLDFLEDKRPFNNSRTKTNSPYWTFVLRLRCNFDKKENLEWLFGESNEWKKRKNGEKKPDNIQSNYSFNQKVINKFKEPEVISNQSPSRNREENSDTERLQRILFRRLIRLNFYEQNREFKAIIENNRISAFLIYGKAAYGQESLITRLCQLPHLKNNSKIIPLDMSKKAISQHEDNLWSYLRKELELELEVDPDIEPEKISERISKKISDIVVNGWWKTQNVVFIFYSVDCMIETTLSALIEKFWKPIFDKAYPVQHPEEEDTRLILLLVDLANEDHSDICKARRKWEKNRDKYTPFILPENKKFTNSVLQSWLDRAIDEEIVPEGLTTEAIIRKSKDGIPEYVYNIICKHCNKDWTWEGYLAQWLV